MENVGSESPLQWLENASRTASFWGRASLIYAAYKLTQFRAVAATSLIAWNEEDVEARIWQPQHKWAGQQMYLLAVDLRGFYLKVGQFLGSRGDFLPEALCAELAGLHDAVPPMSRQQSRQVIERELGGRKLESVFEWIELSPIGSASIAQVHRAQAKKQFAGLGPDGLVAVKIQYPGALPTMRKDLIQIRRAAQFLQKTELRFDLTSPVDELAGQVRLEFDFVREARLMTRIRDHLRDLRSMITIPTPIVEMLTERLLVMSFLDGLPISKLKDSMSDRSVAEQELGKKLILERISEAYGRMILLEGLFHADCHPGNLMVLPEARIGLLDFGQAKQLSQSLRWDFSRLILALDNQDEQQISEALLKVGVVTERDDSSLRSEMAYGMFDTRGRVDPFDANSPLKKIAVESFNRDMFFVLRVIQLLRGLATNMGVEDFSTAHHWRPLAEYTLGMRASLPAPRGMPAFTATHAFYISIRHVLDDWLWWGGLGVPVRARLLQAALVLGPTGWALGRTSAWWRLALWVGLYSMLLTSVLLAAHQRLSLWLVMGVAALAGHLYLHFKCWHCPENRGFIQSRARIILGMALASIGMFCKVHVGAALLLLPYTAWACGVLAILTITTASFRTAIAPGGVLSFSASSSTAQLQAQEGGGVMPALVSTALPAHSSTASPHGLRPRAPSSGHGQIKYPLLGGHPQFSGHPLPRHSRRCRAAGVGLQRGSAASLQHRKLQAHADRHAAAAAAEETGVHLQKYFTSTVPINRAAADITSTPHSSPLSEQWQSAEQLAHASPPLQHTATHEAAMHVLSSRASPLPSSSPIGPRGTLPLPPAKLQSLQNCKHPAQAKPWHGGNAVPAVFLPCRRLSGLHSRARQLSPVSAMQPQCSARFTI
ncbi:hypothetical protein WJX74_011071 [Apatococcus lobatus]|uniref:Protein kinase domain-containing protein n=1 Tax=Apatococcus lobatus TaxID=904363 RepID=A0AAW1QZ23_9CHLO